MLSSRVPTKQLAITCRSLATMLDSGVPVVKAFDNAARKARDSRLRWVFRHVTMQLSAGDDIATALRAHGDYFPDLTLDMVSIAEQTGALPEVLRALADHYENNLRLRRNFLALITFPVIQFTAAIFVIAGLIFILGILPGDPMDVLGFGLLGPAGAMKWLGGWAILLTTLFILYKLVTTSLQGKSIIHTLLLHVPVIGKCMRDFAVARFSWAYHLTQEAGMPVDESLEASLRATANGAFVAATPHIVSDVMEGETLTDALTNCDLFPDEFLQIVDTAETSGTVPEALHRLSPQFEDQARRSLRALAIAAGWLIWMGVAAFIIFLVFRIVLWYVGLLNSFADEALGV
jgi:type II secretory pathway component PulF